MNTLIQTALACVPGISAVLLTSVVGYGLAFWWNFKLKRRELDLAAVRSFQELYGEFFAVWKLWDFQFRNGRLQNDGDENRSKLLEKAANAEGRMEALLLALATRHDISPISLEALGQFRQVFQQLRESIRDGRRLDWDSSEHPVYKEFKRLSPIVSHIIETGGNSGGSASSKRVAAWSEVTSNKHERRMSENQR